MSGCSMRASLVGISLLMCVAQPVAAGQAVDHSAWDQMLHRHVKDGRVDYEAFLHERDVLMRYLGMLGNVAPGQLPHDEQLAFWINAYNACVITGVFDHYPLKSVKDVRGFFDKIRYHIAGRDLTLNDIEAQGRAFHDWRIHVAVVCASASCPPIRAEAYTADRLEAQLTDQVTRFLKNSRDGLRIDGSTLWVSSIFKWYAKDFVTGTETAESLLAVLQPYLDAAVVDTARKQKLSLKFLPYDWTLNKPAHPQ